MIEKDIKLKFVLDWLNDFKKLLKIDNLRLYSMEFPVTTPDGTKFVDIILEIMKYDSPMDNILIVLEFKKDKIDIGVVDQVLRYSTYVKKQLPVILPLNEYFVNQITLY